MTITKKASALLPVLLAGAILSGCNTGGNPSEAANTPANTQYSIGIVQVVEHEALDSAREGFIAALADNGYTDGQNITLDIQNAQGDITNLSTICDRFVGDKVDMVLAIATDSAQTMASKTTDIPILATAVTSFTTAGLVESDENPGGNVTGTSDMNPVASQIALIKELVPEVKTIGLLYTSSEDNSLLQIEMAKAEIERLGLTYREAAVSSSSDIQQAMRSLVGKCEAVYIPTDNNVASAMPTVHSVAIEAKLPVICGAVSMVNSGGLVTMGIDYYQLGYKTGLMAIKVIEGADPATMPIEYAEMSDEVIFNTLVAEEIGFTIPEKYTAKN